MTFKKRMCVLVADELFSTLPPLSHRRKATSLSISISTENVQMSDIPLCPTPNLTLPAKISHTAYIEKNHPYSIRVSLVSSKLASCQKQLFCVRESHDDAFPITTILTFSSLTLTAHATIAFSTLIGIGSFIG